MSLRLIIQSPERVCLDREVASAVLPGVAGFFGVQGGHAPLVAALGAGSVKVVGVDGGEAWYVIDAGLAEVAAGQTVILANQVFPVADAVSAEQRLGELRATLAAAATR